MKSAKFIYNQVNSEIQPFIPSASLQFSDNFWYKFEPYMLETGTKNCQAFVGELVKVDQNSIKCFFKVSQEEDSIVLHEYEVIRKLTERLDNFPHFCKTYGIVKYKSHVNIEKGFWTEGDENHFVLRDMLLLESIPSIGSLSDFIETSRDTNAIISLFKQILMCIRSFRAVGLTHYDLHTENILIRKCARDVVLEYKFGEKTFKVPTLGYIAVVIDFGYSFIRGLETFLFTQSCMYSGHLNDRFMPYSDYVRFLYNVAYDLRNSPDVVKQNIRRKCLKPFYAASIRINKKNGWEKTRLPNKLDCLYGIMNKTPIFADLVWLDILRILFRGRAENISSKDSIEEVVLKVMAEWSNIEERITDASLLKYLFHYLVNVIKKCRYAEHKTDAVKSIFLDEFTRLVKLFLPAVDYQSLIESIENLSLLIEEYINQAARERAAEIEKNYKFVPFTHETCDDYIWNLFGNFNLSTTNEEISYKIQVSNEQVE